MILYCTAVVLWRRQWHPTPVLLPGKSRCSPWGREESDTAEWLHFHFSLSCIGEGNGNPLQRSCLGNPRDRGALWAAVYGVAQSQTWLKWLTSSSSYSYASWNPEVKWIMSVTWFEKHQKTEISRQMDKYIDKWYSCMFILESRR